MRGRLRGGIAFVVAASMALCACGSSEPEDGDGAGATLPEAEDLLQRSSQAMREVSTASFDLEIEGTIGGVPVRRASGVLTSEGEAEATVVIEQEGDLVELAVLVAEGTIYLRGPTGQYRPLPTDVGGGLFDPSRILKPEEGLAVLLEGAEQATTEAVEEVAGAEAFRVSALLDKDVVARVMPLGSLRDLEGALWIAREPARLVRFRVATTPEQGEETVFTMTLSDFDVPVDISAPDS